MTFNDARLKAHQMWGIMSVVTETDPRTYQDESKRFWVASLVYPVGGIVGHGASWEEAFANAKKRDDL